MRPILFESNPNKKGFQDIPSQELKKISQEQIEFETLGKKFIIEIDPIPHLIAGKMEELATSRAVSGKSITVIDGDGKRDIIHRPLARFILQQRYGRFIIGSKLAWQGERGIFPGPGRLRV